MRARGQICIRAARCHAVDLAEKERRKAVAIHRAVATSLMVVAIVSASAFLSMLAHGREIPWPAATMFLADHGADVVKLEAAGTAAPGAGEEEVSPDHGVPEGETEHEAVADREPGLDEGGPRGKERDRDHGKARSPERAR